jgi:superfamily II DNA helicase RecQ
MPNSDLVETSRKAAKASRGYDYKKTRATICKKLSNAFDSKEPYTWQVDVCEAILLGLDCIVIASTGAGKSMPFIMPLLVDETCRKIVIIISPLNELEYDQVRPPVVLVISYH